MQINKKFDSTTYGSDHTHTKSLNKKKKNALKAMLIY